MSIVKGEHKNWAEEATTGTERQVEKGSKRG